MSTTTSIATESAAAAASKAASGNNGIAKLPSLQTPVSASYPSELRSPLVGTPAFLKKEETINTPITPPSAYMDFLKGWSPVLMSPPTTSGSTSKFPSIDKTTCDRITECRSSEERSEKASSVDNVKSPPVSRSPPTSNPALSRQTSSDSSTSFSTVSSFSSEDSAPSTIRAESRTKPQSPRIIIPPSSFAKPGPGSSARTPRALPVPQSPFSAANVRSPISARSLQSPYSASAMSATPWSASFSPSSFTARDSAEVAESKSKSSKVCVRQVVTRTVTYCRTPLDPAPKGKRRKTEGQENKEESPES